MLSKEEILRFKRQLQLPELGEQGQEALKNARVLVVGAGGLGNVVCAYLAAAGVGKLTIIDHDIVDVSNLQRQVMFTQNDLGLSKAKQLAFRLNQLNELSEYQYINQKFTLENSIELSVGQDLIIDCVDQIDVRYLLNDVSVFQNIPLIYGAIHRFEGQVAVFNYQGSGTYRCAFPEKKSIQKSPTCQEEGVIGVLPGIIGLYQAMEALKIIGQLKWVMKNQILMVNLLQTSHVKIAFKRNDKAIEMAKNRMASIQESSIEKENNSIYFNDIESFLKKKTSIIIIDIQEELEQPELYGIPVKHIPAYLFQEQIQLFDKAQSILVYCSKGVKSSWAIEVMKQFGFKYIYQIAGGISSVKEKRNG